MTMTDKELADRLRHSTATASNDDYSEALSEKRQRHSDRVETMLEAATRIDQLSARVVELASEGRRWQELWHEAEADFAKTRTALQFAESALAAERATRGELEKALTWIADAREHEPKALSPVLLSACMIAARTVLHSPEGKQPSPTGEAGK